MPTEVDTDTLLLIVVGAHIRAEVSDRPLGDRLRDIIANWLDEHLDEPDDQPVQPVVCTDLWYLNHKELHQRPVIAIGTPELNAATAFFGSRLPRAYVIDDTLCVHADLEFLDMRVCMWGVTNAATVSAVDLFAERYLDGYLRAAHDMPAERAE